MYNFVHFEILIFVHFKFIIYRFEKEIAGTQRLLEFIRYNPVILEDYDESLFSHTVEQVIIGQKNTITFKLINGLELIEKAGIGGEQE